MKKTILLLTAITVLGCKKDDDKCFCTGVFYDTERQFEVNSRNTEIDCETGDALEHPYSGLIFLRCDD